MRRRSAANPVSCRSTIVLDNQASKPEERQSGLETIVQVTPILASLFDSAQGDTSFYSFRLCSELEGSASYIKHVKVKISTIQCSNINSYYLSIAASESDAIGTHLEQIISAVSGDYKEIQCIGAELRPPVRSRVTRGFTRIHEACSFQDIDAQRSTEVIQILKIIDARFVNMPSFSNQDVELVKDSAVTIASLSSTAQPDLFNGSQSLTICKNQCTVGAILSEAH